MIPLSWTDSESHVLFNPRMAETETRAIKERLRKLRDLPGHLWIATSGSTAQAAGALKWVALSKKAILASAQGVNRHLRSGSHDIWIHALPDFHVGGIGIHARAFLSGARAVLLGDRWSAREFHSRCHSERATLSALVPAQVFDLVREGLSAPESLRAVVIGGGALSESLYREARALGWNLLPSYGLTECCSQVATASLDSLTCDDFPKLEILPHVEMRVAADGRLCMSGDSLLTGYAVLSLEGDRWVDPRVEGWFESEDLGTVEDRILRIQGRGSDFVKIGGESVDLNRLERIFSEIKVREKVSFDAVIIAVPNERLGHVIHGVSTSEDGQKIFSLFDSQVLPFERVRKIHLVSQIPRSPLQKLLKAALLETIQAGVG